MDIVAEELERFFGWHQRLGRVSQSFEQLFLGFGIFFAREDAKSALAKLRIGIVRGYSEGGQVGGALGIKLARGESSSLSGLKGRQPQG